MDSCRSCARQIDDAHIVRLQDGHIYCVSCIRGTFGDARMPDMLSETLTVDQLITSTAWIKSLAGSALFILSLFIIPLLLAGLPAVSVLGCTVPLIAVVTALLGIRANLEASQLKARLPRTVTIDSGKVIVTRPGKTSSVPLADCRWFVGSTKQDEAGSYLAGVPSVVLQTPEERIACGLTAEQRKQWGAFLALAHVPRIIPLRAARLLICCVVGLAVGAGLGMCIGVLVDTIIVGQGFLWTVALSFLGACDGLASALLLATWSDATDQIKSSFTPWLPAIGFAAMGFMVAGVGHWGDRLVCGVVNGWIGFVAGRITAAKLKRSASSEAE